MCVCFFPMAEPFSYVLWRSLISDEFPTLTILHFAESISCHALPTYLHKKHTSLTGVSFSSFHNTSFKINLAAYPQLNFPLLSLHILPLPHRISTDKSCEESIVVWTLTGDIIKEVCSLQTGPETWLGQGDAECLE